MQEFYEAYFYIKKSPAARYSIEAKYRFGEELPMMVSECVGIEKHHGDQYAEGLFLAMSLFKKGASTHAMAYDYLERKKKNKWNPERNWDIAFEKAYNLTEKRLLDFLNYIWLASDKSYLRGNVFLVSPLVNKMQIAKNGDACVSFEKIVEWLCEEGIILAEKKEKTK